MEVRAELTATVWKVVAEVGATVAEGDELVIYDPENLAKELGRLTFTVCVGKGGKDIFSAAQYFYPKSSGQMDLVGLQITTTGSNVGKAIRAFKEQNDSESSLYLQGLSDRVTEDLAEYIHNLLRHRIGQTCEKYGMR